MLVWLLRLFARLPLPIIHGLGVVAGWLLYLCSRKHAARLRQNIAGSGLCAEKGEYRRLLRRSIAEAGKGALETFAVWFRQPDRALLLVRACHGWEYVEAALTARRGIIFITPHLGCFEITALYYAAKHPISVLYRPPRKQWLEPLIYAGRERSQIKLAPTNLRGVRSMLQALKRGEAIGILPDQVPNTGEGEWADFFGKPAYTMTLASRLAGATGATVLLAFGERLPFGKGYVIHITPLDAADVSSPAALNQTIAALVRQCPEQYLWGYNRYRLPRDPRSAPYRHNKPNPG